MQKYIGKKRGEELYIEEYKRLLPHAVHGDGLLSVRFMGKCWQEREWGAASPLTIYITFTQLPTHSDTTTHPLSLSRATDDAPPTPPRPFLIIEMKMIENQQFNSKWQFTIDEEKSFFFIVLFFIILLIQFTINYGTFNGRGYIYILFRPPLPI